MLNLTNLPIETSDQLIIKVLNQAATLTKINRACKRKTRHIKTLRAQNKALRDLVHELLPSAIRATNGPLPLEMAERLRAVMRLSGNGERR